MSFPVEKEEDMENTVQSLLCPEDSRQPRKTIRMLAIRTVFEREVIRENAPSYLKFKRFTSPHQIYETFSELRRETKEHFISLHLDGKNRIICFDRVSVGSLNQSIIHPREVFKAAIHSSAAAILLMHNHPSDDPSPSREDIEITRRLKEAGELLSIRVLDHIIIGEGYFSFAEQGML
jgi:DNA repair protein RadC